MRLGEAQEAFARLARMRDREEAAALAARAGIDPAVPAGVAELFAGIDPERLELYQSLVRGSNFGTLDRCFSRLAERLGDDWYALCRAYVRSSPGTHWDLNRLADGLPRFLAEVWLPEHPEQPAWLKDLAEYERIELDAFLAEDSGLDGEGHSKYLPRVNPTLELGAFEHDIAGWVQASEAGREAEPRAGRTLTAIYRDPETLYCRFLNLNPLTALVLQHWAEGTDSPALAEALAPQLGMNEEQCLEQLELLACSLQKDRAVSF